MKEIYYPEFEMRSKTMIYQTILLKEQMNFIVPSYFDNVMSKDFNKVENIDVFKKYRVEENYRVIENASRNFIDFIERIIEREQLRNLVFTPEVDDYLIVSQKMPYDFPDKIGELAFGIKEDNGIRMNKNFAKLYMNYLTDEIVGVEKYVKTTNVYNDNQIQNMLMKLYDLSENNNRLIRTSVQEIVFSMIVPSEMYRYSIEDIINIRRNPSYGKAVIEFNKLLENMILRFSQDKQPLDLRLFQEYDNKIEEYRTIMGDEIQSVLGRAGLISIPIVLGCLTSNIPLSLSVGLGAEVGTRFLETKKNKSEYTFTEKAATRKIINRIRQTTLNNY